MEYGGGNLAHKRRWEVILLNHYTMYSNQPELATKFSNWKISPLAVMQSAYVMRHILSTCTPTEVFPPQSKPPPLRILQYSNQQQYDDRPLYSPHYVTSLQIVHFSALIQLHSSRPHALYATISSLYSTIFPSSCPTIHLAHYSPTLRSTLRSQQNKD